MEQRRRVIMSDSIYAFCVIGICSVVTIIIRALPFLVFGNKKLPDTVDYLGKMLPGAIMIVLVVYCLRGISLTSAPYGAPELICVALCAFLQLALKNSIPSIAISTAVYMILIRTVF